MRIRHRMNYFEPNIYALDQHFSSFATSSNTTVIITSNQGSIGWEHFICGRITLDFYPIVDSYYRSIIYSGDRLHLQYPSASLDRILLRDYTQSSTVNISSPQKNSPESSIQVLPSNYKSLTTSKTMVLKIHQLLRLLDSR